MIEISQTLTLRVSEIFYSLQGETRTMGLPTVFIRLVGCPLRCQFCDTKYAYVGGKNHSVDNIISEVASFFPRYVTVTGGEPLAQKNTLSLLKKLCDQGYEVSLETSGAIDISGVDRRVTKVVDVKTPGSGEAKQNLYRNFDYILAHDQIKFVICDRNDYDWSVELIAQHKLIDRCQILFSPSHEQLSAKKLADWIVADRLPVRFQIQLHKYIWGEQPGK